MYTPLKSIDDAIAAANQGDAEGLKGFYPVSAKMLADEVVRLRHAEKALKGFLETLTLMDL